MNTKRLFTWLALAVSVICLAVFAWANAPANTEPIKTVTVTTESDLRTAVANEDSGNIIVISGTINITSGYLTIPADRTVTLSLDSGSRLDFSNCLNSCVKYNSHIGIDNLGHLTIAGSGEIKMSKEVPDAFNNRPVHLIHCSGNASLEVTGGNLNAINKYSNVYVIYNKAASSSVTVAGGDLTASGNLATSIIDYSNVYVIYNEAAGSSVTVTGGNLTAGGSGTVSYACAIYNKAADSSVMVTGGSLTANPNYTSYINTFNVGGSAISNNGENSSVTVTGGSLTANPVSTLTGVNVALNSSAISNYGKNSSVTVTDGKLTANGRAGFGPSGYIYSSAIRNNGENSSVTVISGDLTAENDSSSNVSNIWRDAIYNEAANSSVTVTGGSLTAKTTNYQSNSNSSAIQNKGAGSSVTVTGGSLTADKGLQNRAIWNNNAANSSVAVIGGSLTAKGTATNTTNYAINVSGNGNNTSVTVTGGIISAPATYGVTAHAVYTENSDSSVTVLSGDFTGRLSDNGSITIHGGIFGGVVPPDGVVAPGCVSETDSGVTRIINCASLSLDAAESGDEYECTVSYGMSVAVNVSALISKDLTGGTGASENIKDTITVLDAIDKAALPQSLQVTASSADKAITVTNNGCTPGTYRITMLAGGANDRKAARTLKIVVPGDIKLTFTPVSASVKVGENTKVSVALTVDGKQVSIDKLETVFGVDGLSVTPAEGNDKLMITADTFCKPDTYTVKVTAGYSSGNTTTADLEITVGGGSLPAPAEPVVPSVDVLPKEVVNKEAEVFTGEKEAYNIISTDFAEDELSKDASGKYAVISPTLAAEMIHNMEGRKATEKTIRALPITKTNYDYTGTPRIVMISFAVNGNFFANEAGEITTTDPSELRVYEALNGKEGKESTQSSLSAVTAETSAAKCGRFTYTADLSDPKDMQFTLLNADGTIATKIEETGNYILSIFILDNGEYDIDGGTWGSVASAIFIDTAATKGRKGGSSVGCNAGFAALALTGLAFIPVRRRKR